MLQYLGLTLADVIVKMIMDKAVKKHLPQILKHIDSILPFAIEQNGTPAQVKQIFADAITFETNRPATPLDVELVERIFKPSEAAKTVFNVERLTNPVEYVPVEKEKEVDRNRLEKKDKMIELKAAMDRERGKRATEIDHLRLSRLEERYKKLKKSLKDN